MIATDLDLPHETVNKIGRNAHAFRLDVSAEEDWQSAASKSREVGEVDNLVMTWVTFPIALSTIWICPHGERQSLRISTPIS